MKKHIEQHIKKLSTLVLIISVFALSYEMETKLTCFTKSQLMDWSSYLPNSKTSCNKVSTNSFLKSTFPDPFWQDLTTFIPGYQSDTVINGC